jgi:hypothetical protein
VSIKPELKISRKKRTKAKRTRMLPHSKTQLFIGRPRKIGQTRTLELETIFLWGSLIEKWIPRVYRDTECIDWQDFVGSMRDPHGIHQRNHFGFRSAWKMNLSRRRLSFFLPIHLPCLCIILQKRQN